MRESQLTVCSVGGLGAEPGRDDDELDEHDQDAEDAEHEERDDGRLG